jgi:hypothetical protein
MDERLRPGLLGRDRARTAVGLAVGAVLAAAVVATGVSQVPTTPTGYDALGDPLHPEPAIVSPTWVAAIAVVAGIVATGYAYWNGGLLGYLASVSVRRTQPG